MAMPMLFISALELYVKFRSIPCSQLSNGSTVKRCLNEKRSGIPSYIRHVYRKNK
jgi:hypothetical protein